MKCRIGEASPPKSSIRVRKYKLDILNSVGVRCATWAKLLERVCFQCPLSASQIAYRLCNCTKDFEDLFKACCQEIFFVLRLCQITKVGNIMQSDRVEPSRLSKQPANVGVFGFAYYF